MQFFFIMNKSKALFVYTRLSTFVKSDLDILSESFSVKTLQTDNTTQVRQLFSLIRQFSYLLFNIWRFDIVYIWFADYHSFLPVFFAKLAHKRSFLVIGGYDVCRIRKVKYGSFINPVRGYMARFSMSNATRCICVSNHIQRIVGFITGKARTIVIYNCVSIKDAEYETTDTTGLHIPTPREGVLSVSIAESTQSIYVKGVDRIVNLAKELIDINITLVGVNKEKLESICGAIPANLTVIPRVSHEELTEYFYNNKAYCQLSRSESFSVALAEAMYCNCIPVVANTGGMPEVVGLLGHIVDGNNSKSCAAAISKALEQPTTNQYRQRIEENFSSQKRAAAIKQLISDQ